MIIRFIDILLVTFIDNEHIYKLNIDELLNIVFEYKSSNAGTRDVNDNTVIFNISYRKWINPTSLIRSSDNNSKTNSQCNSNIKDDIFEYCYSIRYKL